MVPNLLLRNMLRVSRLSVRTVKKGPYDAYDSEIEEILIDDEVMGSQDKSTKIETPKQEEYIVSGTQEEFNPSDDGRERPTSGPMERSLNSVTLIGRVGTEPTLRGTANKPVLTFSLATNTNWKVMETDSWAHRTDWHNVVVFDKFVRESAYKYIGKGHRIHLQGRIAYGEITDRLGVRRHTTSIIAEDIIILAASARNSPRNNQQY